MYGTLYMYLLHVNIYMQYGHVDCFHSSLQPFPWTIVSYLAWTGDIASILGRQWSTRDMLSVC